MYFTPLEHIVTFFLNNSLVFIEILRVGVFRQATSIDFYKYTNSIIVMMKIQSI